MKKAALYIRVSTTHQIDKDSLPFQRQELQNYSKYVLGIDDFEVFEDAGYSAKNTDRPKYQEMMGRIRNKEFTHLLVWKIDRISRNLRDFTEMYDEIKACGITFISKNEQFDTSSAMGEAMLKIILVFAELERKITAERVYSIMLSRAEKGLWNGATVPLGYSWSDEIKFPVINEFEARTVQYIYKLYEELASTSQVAFKLNSEQIQTKRGGKWTAKTINDVLRNPFYIGTYRYNVKTSGTRRWKDEKEWVVVEDNHPGIVTHEQFEKVNSMLSANYRGNGDFQRSSSNVHIFSKILYCGNCGMNFNAGLDRPRKDGYQPSRYTCSQNHFIENHKNCNNFVSDITVLPFVLNYINNFLRLADNITAKHSLRDLEKMLLHGNAFCDVIHIDENGLHQTMTYLINGFTDAAFESGIIDGDGLDMELENLKKEKQKHEKALSRLEDLYLYSEESMSQKDFLFKKHDISQNIERINREISSHNENKTDMRLSTDISYLSKASNFLIAKGMKNKMSIDFKELLMASDRPLLRDFIQAAIQKIIIADKRVSSITFQNGITHKFLYKPIEKQKQRTKEKLFYRSYEPMLLEYLSTHESFTRVDIEKLTGMGHTGAGSIIREFLESGIIEKRGNSTAIRYYLNKSHC